MFAETKLGRPATWIKLSGGSPSDAWCLACGRRLGFLALLGPKDLRRLGILSISKPAFSTQRCHQIRIILLCFKSGRRLLPFSEQGTRISHWVARRIPPPLAVEWQAPFEGSGMYVYQYRLGVQCAHTYIYIYIAIYIYIHMCSKQKSACVPVPDM